MKYCPTCETRYDEEVLRFCMKDGTPLLDEAEPNFIQMPSEDLEIPEVEADDPSEVTVIRRNIPTPPPIEQPPAPAPREDDYSDVRPNSGGQRIVVPTFEAQQRERARVAAQYQAQQPRGANTILVVLLTIFGTIIVVGVGGVLLYLLVVDRSGNTNANANTNLNANQNVNANVSNTLFDFNTNGNFNSPGNANVNVNANTRTPTPTPTATPRPSESPLPTPDNDDDPDARPTPSRTPVSTPTPIIIRPGATPTTPRTPLPTPRTIMTPSNRPS